MYTHLFITKEDAERLHNTFVYKPIPRAEIGLLTRPFKEHFRVYTEVYIDVLEANMRIDKAHGGFVLEFGRYIPCLPGPLEELNIVPVLAEIRRFNNAPTRAPAGYYEDRQYGLYATIEEVVPSGGSVCAQNLVVSAPSLEDVQDFNERLSKGECRNLLKRMFR
jgi:hypothetical protein